MSDHPPRSSVDDIVESGRRPYRPLDRDQSLVDHVRSLERWARLAAVLAAMAFVTSAAVFALMWQARGNPFASESSRPSAFAAVVDQRGGIAATTPAPTTAPTARIAPTAFDVRSLDALEQAMLDGEIELPADLDPDVAASDSSRPFAEISNVASVAAVAPVARPRSKPVKKVPTVSPPAVPAPAAEEVTSAVRAGFRVAQAVFTTGIKDLTPTAVGTEFPAGTRRLYFWNRIAADAYAEIPMSERTVTHVWFHDGKEIRRRTVEIGSHWYRSYSLVTNPAPGEWEVQVTDGTGRLLIQQAARVGP